MVDYGCEAEAVTRFSWSGQPIGRYAPDVDRQIQVRDDDLYLVGRKAGDETRLTFDGEPYFSYAKWPDASQMTMLGIHTSATSTVCRSIRPRPGPAK